MTICCYTQQVDSKDGASSCMFLRRACQRTHSSLPHGLTVFLTGMGTDEHRLYPYVSNIRGELESTGYELGHGQVLRLQEYQQHRGSSIVVPVSVEFLFISPS
jgi:hypothetical protein